MNYRKINNLTGWIIGAIATFVYLITMEPTVSFWDCGEFLATAQKLEVGHSPGAPLFMMLGRFFGMLAPTPDKVALYINGLSAIMSGLTILFLFWTITYFAKRLLAKNEEQPSSYNTLLIMGSGIVGALAYTFSDTFWFSAVEAEVYATSSFFTALVFWAILKWEGIADQKYADRWLVFIAYMIGLSIGIHLLNLLTIPALAMVYYFKRYDVNRKGIIMTFIIGCVFLGLVQFGIIQGIPLLASKFELLFVNSFGLPHDIGAIFLILLFVGLLIYGLLWASDSINPKINVILVRIVFIIFLLTIGGLIYILLWIILPSSENSKPNPLNKLTRNSDKKLIGGVCSGIAHYTNIKVKSIIHTTLLSFLFVFIGFLSYLAPLIRSRADVPIDMTNPDNAFRFLSYVNREQFGSQPILYGPTFASPVTEYATTGEIYDLVKKDGKESYEVIGKKQEPVFGDKTLFPRMWDGNDPSHVAFYKSYCNLEDGEAPSGADNMKYFLGYQLNWMWWRYLMWNYAGRQNDFEGQGDAKNGNWSSGIKPIDQFFTGAGDSDRMQDGYKNNPARNQLYFLPLILGILGIVFQFNAHKKDGFIVGLLFFFTGIAIAIYLNMPPNQPRERDYAFAGSTYAFAIWIGLGVLMVNQFFQRFIKGNVAAILSIALCLLAVPTLMAKVEWNDHDRSQKTLARATAYNTLMSCEEGAILFTFGDNDTYPLWYLQEVEGIRPDVRIVNLSLLGIDWYVDQLSYKINKNDALPMIWKRSDYMGDAGNYTAYMKEDKIPEGQYINLLELCKYAIDPARKLQMQNGGEANRLPTKNASLTSLSKDKLVQMGMISAADTDKIDNEVRFTINKDNLMKDDLALMNIVAGIAAEGWKRPIYFGSGMGDSYLGLNDYLKLEGTVYRLVPFKYKPGMFPPSQDLGFVDVEKTKNLFLNKYIWGNANKKNVYFDEKNRIMFVSYRLSAARLAETLAAMNRSKEGVAVLDKVMENITEQSYYYDFTAIYVAMAYYRCGAFDKANALAKKLVKNADDDIAWINNLNENFKESLYNDVRRDLQGIYMLLQSAQQAGDANGTKTLNDKFTQLQKLPIIQTVMQQQ